MWEQINKCVQLVFFKFIFEETDRETERERQRERVGRGREREGKRESQTGSALSVQSPVMGLNLMNGEVMT